MSLSIGQVPDVTNAQIQKVYKKMSRKIRNKILTSDGYMLGSLSDIDLSEAEKAARAKVMAQNAKTKKEFDMMRSAKKGIMSEAEYDLRKKNIEKRALEANPKVKKFRIKKQY